VVSKQVIAYAGTQTSLAAKPACQICHVGGFATANHEKLASEQRFTGSGPFLRPDLKVDIHAADGKNHWSMHRVVAAMLVARRLTAGA
jgi:hypothetical protein